MRTTSSIFPAPEELPGLVPGRDSLSWRVFGDARSLSAPGYALLLQVAHPTVGAGVTKALELQGRPVGRLWRTLDYVALSVYAGPQRAGATRRRIHEMHRRIKGITPDGTRYHALEPEAYAWVHATLALAGVEGTRRFARPLRPDQVEAFWAEWRALGRTLGIRERDLPQSWTALDARRGARDACAGARIADGDAADAAPGSPFRRGIPAPARAGADAVRCRRADAGPGRGVGCMSPTATPALLARALDPSVRPPDDATSDAILDAAVALAAASGLGNLTMDDVARSPATRPRSISWPTASSHRCGSPARTG